MKRINVGILGCGTVGGGTFDILRDNAEMIEKRTGVSIQVTKIFDIKHRADIDESLFTDNIEDVCCNDNIDVVVETLGGIDLPAEFMAFAMDHKKHVVTANKAAVAHNYELLTQKAKKNGVKFLYEASVGGGIPCLSAILGNLAGNNFSEVMGIVNGTTNYILTKMYDDGADYDSVLKEAQRLGFAEADPTADVEGIDAANKLSILIALMFDKYIKPEEIERTGISKITLQDIENAKKNGNKIKLIAHAKKEEGKIICSVKPEEVPISHPLSGVNNEFNAVYITGDMVNEVMLYGKGAGALPTGSAIVGDIISIGKQA